MKGSSNQRDTTARRRNRWQRLASLRWRDYAGTLCGVICVMRAAVSLRRGSLPQVLERFGLPAPFPPATPTEVEESVRWVRWAHVLVPVEKNCLVDSLAAALLLRKFKRNAALTIGVNRCDGAFQAHAWLEGDANAERAFQVLWRSTAASP